MRPKRYDQTQLRSKSPLIRQKCARTGYDQTQLRSKSPLIRPKCARIRLWSDFSDQIDLWSDHLQTIVQTVVRSKFLPDPVISFWEHTGVRSTGSDQKPIWVWTSTWGSIETKLLPVKNYKNRRFIITTMTKFEGEDLQKMQKDTINLVYFETKSFKKRWNNNGESIQKLRSSHCCWRRVTITKELIRK